MKQVAIIGSPKLHQAYQAALEKASCKAVIFPDSAYVEKHFQDFDGLLLPGGGDVFPVLSDYASFAKNLSADCKICERCAAEHLPAIEQLCALHLFYQQEKPIFGICKGMQLINLYFHGSIREVSNRKLHQHPKEDTRHLADNEQGSFLHALFGAHMLINSNHHQCVDRIGQNMQAIQYAQDREIEAISHLSLPVIGTQWHPERMPKLQRQDSTLLFQYFVSLL